MKKHYYLEEIELSIKNCSCYLYNTIRDELNEYWIYDDDENDYYTTDYEVFSFWKSYSNNMYTIENAASQFEERSVFFNKLGDKIDFDYENISNYNYSELEKKVLEVVNNMKKDIDNY